MRALRQPRSTNFINGMPAVGKPPTHSTSVWIAELAVQFRGLRDHPRAAAELLVRRCGDRQHHRQDGHADHQFDERQAAASAQGREGQGGEHSSVGGVSAFPPLFGRPQARLSVGTPAAMEARVREACHAHGRRASWRNARPRRRLRIPTGRAARTGRSPAGLRLQWSLRRIPTAESFAPTTKTE